MELTTAAIIVAGVAFFGFIVDDWSNLPSTPPAIASSTPTPRPQPPAISPPPVKIPQAPNAAHTPTPSPILPQPPKQHATAIAAWSTTVDSTPQVQPDANIVRLQRYLGDLGIYNSAAVSGEFDSTTQDAITLLAQLARLPRADNTLEALTQIYAAHYRIKRRRPVGPRHLIPSTAPDIVLLILDGNDLAAFARFIISLLDDRTLIASATRTTSSGLEFSARAFMTRKPLASARPVTCRYYEATIRSGVFVVEVPGTQACRYAFGPWHISSAAL